jgi:hypothetical protein
MKIAIKDEGTVVDMSFYVAQILEGEEVEVVASPTTKTTYNVDEKAQRLGEEERKWFHSKTAKLLYLSKRAWPDILTAVISCVLEYRRLHVRIKRNYSECWDT